MIILQKIIKHQFFRSLYHDEFTKMVGQNIKQAIQN